MWGLQAAPPLRGRAVAVYDARVGTCEIFRSPTMCSLQAPVIALWFDDGHYQWLRWDNDPPRLPTLLELHQAGSGNVPRVPNTLVTNADG